MRCTFPAEPVEHVEPVKPNASGLLGDSRKNDSRRRDADSYVELRLCGALYPAPLARPLSRGLLS